MAVCTFFGHRYTSEAIKPALTSVLTDLIENKGVTTFYVGHQGFFDSMERTELKRMKNIYPNINYYVALAYLAKKSDDLGVTDYSDTIFPDVLTKTPPKYAIDRRNRWMISISDYVVCYCEHNSDFGAPRYMKVAEKRGLTVINLYKKRTQR